MIPPMMFLYTQDMIIIAADNPNMKKSDILMRSSGMHIIRGRLRPDRMMENKPRIKTEYMYPE